MKVLHLISSGGMYGAEAVILNLSVALKAAGHASEIGLFANSTQPNLQLQAAASRLGIASHLIPCRGQLDVSVPKRIRDLVQGRGADLVHAHGYKADVYAALALHRVGTPLVSTCHTWYDNDFAVRVYGAVDRWVLRRFDGVVAVSEDVRNRLLKAGVASSKIRLIGNGVDLEPFAKAERIRLQRHAAAETGDSLRVGLVGRLAPEKGVDIFLRAAAIVLRSHPDAQFVVAGDGPDRTALEVLISEAGIGENVTLLGHTDDMLRFYSSIDVLVSASRQEGLPVALLEGMASGLPLIATNVGAVPMLIGDDKTALAVDAEDSAALSHAILRLLSDSLLRENFSKAGQRLIREEFSSERMAQDYLDLYFSVCNSREAQVA